MSTLSNVHTPIADTVIDCNYSPPPRPRPINIILRQRGNEEESNLR